MQGGRAEREGQVQMQKKTASKGDASQPVLKNARGAFSAITACLALAFGFSAPAQAAGVGFSHAPWNTAQRQLGDSDYATPDRSSSDAVAAAAANALSSARPPSRPERYHFATAQASQGALAEITQDATRELAPNSANGAGPDPTTAKKSVAAADSAQAAAGGAQAGASDLSDDLVSNKAWNDAVKGVVKAIPETANVAPKLLVNDNGPDTWVDARTGAAVPASAPAAIARERALEAARIPQAGGAQANVYWAGGASPAITGASAAQAASGVSLSGRPSASAGRPDASVASPITTTAASTLAASAPQNGLAPDASDSSDGAEAGLTLAERQAVSAGTPQEENLQEPRPFIQLALGRALGRNAAPAPVAVSKIDMIAKANAWPSYGAAWPVALLRFDDSSQNKPGWAWARVVSPIRGNWAVGTPVELRVDPSFLAGEQKGPFLALMSPVEDDSAQTQSRAALLAYAAQGNAFNALRVQRWAAQGEARNAGAQWSLAMAGLLGMVALFCVGPRNRKLTLQRARLGLSCALMGVWSALSYLVARDAAMPGASDILLLLPPLAFCVFCAFVFIVRWPRQGARA